jgi:hypothetical protein
MLPKRWSTTRHNPNNPAPLIDMKHPPQIKEVKPPRTMPEHCKVWMAGHRRAEATPFFERLCPAMTIFAPSTMTTTISLTAFWCEQLICPSCQSVAVDLIRKSAAFLAPSRLGKRGVCAIVTKREAGCDGRGMSPDEGCCRGRSSRMVLTPRRRRQALRKHPQGDGDKKARSPGRVRNKPLKPIARGMPDCFGEPVVTTLVCSFCFACEAAGASRTRYALRPLLSGVTFGKARAGHAAGTRSRVTSADIMCDVINSADDGFLVETSEPTCQSKPASIRVPHCKSSQINLWAHSGLLCAPRV